MDKAPVYIEDIVQQWVTYTESKILTLLQANETAALGSTGIKGIRFSKSSFAELVETLAQADGDTEADPAKNESFRKYPLVHLVQDFSIDRGKDVGVYGTANLNLILVHHTDATYKIDDRDTRVFKPVLWPLYYALIKVIKKSPWVFGDETLTGEFKHRVIKHAFWGTRQLETSRNKLNDYVDALELQNFQVKINYSNC